MSVQPFPPSMTTHPIEKLLLRKSVRRVVGLLTRQTHCGETLFERLMYSFGKPSARWQEKLIVTLPHLLINRSIRHYGTDRAMLMQKLFHHRPTVRALVNTSRSLRTFGLSAPQRFIMPLLVVWNLTRACNLKCRHCYESACPRPDMDELTLAEKLELVDELGKEYVPFLAISGGEPLLSPHLWDVLKRCARRDIHVTLASNGTLITRDVATRLVDHGVKYVEISLDSVDPAKHDNFRGRTGAWQESVNGIRALAKTPGIRVGLAACLSQMNVNELDDLVRLALDLGCSTFVHFNYIPVGHGRDSSIQDLTPWQRELVLKRLNEWLQSGRIGIMSTAPQFARVCLSETVPNAFMAVGHAGSGRGKKTRVLARYVGGCGAGRCYCAIQPNGEVTPCVYMPARVIGSIRERSLKSIWLGNLYGSFLADRSRLFGFCRVCAFREYCGGCRARADAIGGNMFASDPGCLRTTKSVRECPINANGDKHEIGPGHEGGPAISQASLSGRRADNTQWSYE